MMLSCIKTLNGKEMIFYTSLPFEGYLNHEGYYKIEIVHYDSSNLEKGYLILYINDMEKGVIMQTNLMVKHHNASDAVLPLEKLIKMALEKQYEQEVNCMDVELDILIGLECQFLVEKESNYYNVTDVFPIDEELGEFVSKHRLPDQLAQRLPKGLFN
jgi:hypothetical protein